MPYNTWIGDDAAVGSGWIGWGTLGEVDRIEFESIATRFFCFVLPLWPSCSVYQTRSHDGHDRVIEIPRQTRSVVLGYLRATVWLTAVVLATPGVMDPARCWPLLLAGLGAAGVAALLTWVAGRISPAERARRTLLRRVAGIGAPPELLPPKLQTAICSELLEAWAAQSKLRWEDAIEAGVASELLVAIADYHQHAQLASCARANLVDNTRWN